MCSHSAVPSFLELLMENGMRRRRLKLSSLRRVGNVTKMTRSVHWFLHIRAFNLLNIIQCGKYDVFKKPITDACLWSCCRLL